MRTRPASRLVCAAVFVGLPSIMLGLACGLSTAAEIVAPEIPEYDRSAWRHWIDVDGDCQDTRQEVLVAESIEPVTFADERECRVARGHWVDPYTGKSFTDPSDLDVDHLVALRDAHDSGAHVWTDTQREVFANDLDNPAHLQAVSASANRSKGSRGPDEWLPPNPAYRCAYLRAWRDVKARYGLTLTGTEDRLTAYMLRLCDAGIVPVLPQG